MNKLEKLKQISDQYLETWCIDHISTKSLIIESIIMSGAENPDSAINCSEIRKYMIKENLGVTESTIYCNLVDLVNRGIVMVCMRKREHELPRKLFYIPLKEEFIDESKRA